MKELEQEFNLVPLVKDKRKFEIPNPINYKDGDLKHKVGNTIKFVSANVFNDSFNNPHKQIDIPTEKPKQEQIYQNINSDSSLGSVFGILNMNPSDSDYEEENFAREHRKKKPQKKRGMLLE